MLGLDGINFIVKFDNGTYYTGGYPPFIDSVSKDINKALYYAFDWQVMKDLNLSLFLESRKYKYEIIKVRVKTVIEEIEVGEA